MKVTNKKVILVADDEPHILDLIRLILEDKYEVLVAEDGKETLDILNKNRPDLILLDVMMPKINGFEICEKLKKDKKTKDIRIAMLSAKTQEKDIIKGLRLGADYYFTKPFDPANFEKKVEELINQK